MRRWPFVASLGFGLIPVALFGAMAGMIVAKSAPAFVHPGIPELFSRTFASQYTSGGALKCTYGCSRTDYILGLLPAMWGTVLVSAIAIVIALPVALALALVATDFTLGPVGHVVRTLTGMLSGIPPIVYALLAVVFVKDFMIPKFVGGMTFATFDSTRLGVAASDWPAKGVPWNAGAFPWDPTGLNNSTLLSGILIALLVIPFMAPLIEDAIRGVPSAAKEASLALGADRWQTLRRVTVPTALPGIVSALSLGALRAMGDTLIVVFVVGWEANRIPTPPFDVLERTAPLTATGAGLLGGFQGNAACHGSACSAGYFSALLLLVLAVAIVAVSGIAQARLRRRYTQ